MEPTNTTKTFVATYVPEDCDDTWSPEAKELTLEAEPTSEAIRSKALELVPAGFRLSYYSYRGKDEEEDGLS